MKISDYIMDFIAGLNVEHVFYVAGGGAMHLNDSLGRHPKLSGVCMLHEQGASISAESYARIREGYGACLVTSGPGSTNALTGLVGAYMDSIPVIFISGQVKRDDLRENAGCGENMPRQFGIQEVDIISMVGSYSKYAVRIKKPEQIRYELEKAAAIAINGRPGPVWIDVPLDIQASDVDTDSLCGYGDEDVYGTGVPTYDDGRADVGSFAGEAYIESFSSGRGAKIMDEVISRLSKAKRPLIILGHGVRLSHSVDEALELCSVINAPVQTSWNGLDIMWDEHPLFFGRPGIVANRYANIILQHADFVLTLGTRLCLLQTGYNYDGFLKDAFHVMVDIDSAELNKKNIHPNLKVCADAGKFIRAMMGRLTDGECESTSNRSHAELLGKESSSNGHKWADDGSWLLKCHEYKELYPAQINEQSPRDGFVSNYHLMDAISNHMTGDDIYQFTSSGTTTDIAMKMIRLKRGQRAFSTKALAAMGYDIPACIGSCIASGCRRTICVTGDGSIAMNMQELEVIKRLQLPVKIFVSDNGGYAMIYGSERGNFNGRLAGCNKESGLTLPDMNRIADAFGLHTVCIDDESELESAVDEVLSYDGPVVCRVHTDISQPVLPKQANYMKDDGQMASRPLDDMAPLLPRDEYERLKY